MRAHPSVVLILSLLLFMLPAAAAPAAGEYEIESVERVGRIDRGHGEGGADYVAYSIEHSNLYIANRANGSLDIVDITRPSRPILVESIDLSAYGGRVNGVAVSTCVAVAVGNENPVERGHVLLFDHLGAFLTAVQAGVQPVMVAFTPDGRTVLAANEGAPLEDYSEDPEGSVSIIDLSGGPERAEVTDVGFGEFDGEREKLVERGIRIFGPNATVSQDLEPQHITVSADSRRAWVTLQENNAIAEIDVPRRRVAGLHPLGVKDFSVSGNVLDPSDVDGSINLQNVPVHGMYQPDGIFAFLRRGAEYLITANEGEPREYEGFNEVQRAGDLPVEPGIFHDDALLQLEGDAGRLKATKYNGDGDENGRHEKIYSFGGRSFTVWEVREDRSPEPVYDSGGLLERIQAELFPEAFNCAGGSLAGFDQTSDDRGPEPEAVTLGVILGRLYAFIGLEGGPGGVMMFDITDLEKPRFVRWILSNDGTGKEDNDLSPEGLCFVHAQESPTPYPLLIVGHELSGSVAIYEIVPDAPFRSAEKGDVEELTGLFELGAPVGPQAAGDAPAE